MFQDRTDAGRQLAEHLGHLRDQDVVVVGLPRGGVPVADEVARALDAPLDVILVRKLGVPFQPEVGMGAIGEDGVRVLNDEVIRMARVTRSQLDDVESRERVELERRADRYRAGRTRIPLAGRVVLVVDDGIATGSTARAACQVARLEGARREAADGRPAVRSAHRSDARGARGAKAWHRAGRSDRRSRDSGNASAATSRAPTGHCSSSGQASVRSCGASS